MGNIPIAILAFVIAAIGSVANLTNLIVSFVYGLHKKDILLTNLIIADLLLNLIAFPLCGLNILYPDFFKTNQFWCNMTGAPDVCFVLASFNFMGLMGFNRFMHVCHKQAHGKFLSHRNQLLICMLVWTTVIGYDILSVTVSNENEYISNMKYMEDILVSKNLRMNKTVISRSLNL